MTLRVLTLAAALVFGFAFGQNAETQPPTLQDQLEAILVVDEEQDDAPEKGSFWSMFKGGQAYCRVSYDAGLGVSSLCFTEYNLLDLSVGGGHARLGLAAESRLLPDWEIVPIMMVDYVHKTWFMSTELGVSLLGPAKGIRTGATFGVTLQ